MSAPGRPVRPRATSGRNSDDVSALDKRIIEHLQTDGRRPFTQIAADLGVSEAAVRARTNRLIERGSSRSSASPTRSSWASTRWR